MITGVAFVPQAPALVPALGRGLDVELGPVRDACAIAIGRAVASADHVLVVGDGPTTRLHPRFARGSLAAFGEAVDLQLGGTSCGGASTLSPALTVGAYALQGIAGVRRPTYALSVGADAATGDVAENLADITADITESGTRWALLVAGDGSARRSAKAPGYLDDRAAAWDADVAAALATGDPQRLRDLDLDQATDLLAAGARAWAVAGDLAGDTAGGTAGDTGWDADLLHDDAPFGVGYFVAVWTVRA